MGERTFEITKHCKERFIERFSEELPKKWSGSPNDVIAGQNVQRCLREAVEDKSFLNNSKFMDTIYSKYGYDRKHAFFLYNKKCVFACCEIGYQKYFVLTCFRSDRTCFVSSERIKYGKNRKNEEPN